MQGEGLRNMEKIWKPCQWSVQNTLYFSLIYWLYDHNRSKLPSVDHHTHQQHIGWFVVGSLRLIWVYYCAVMVVLNLWDHQHIKLETDHLRHRPTERPTATQRPEIRYQNSLSAFHRSFHGNNLMFLFAFSQLLANTHSVPWKCCFLQPTSASKTNATRNGGGKISHVVCSARRQGNQKK